VTINGIDRVEALIPPGKPEKSNLMTVQKGVDSIHLSAEAQKQAELYRAYTIVSLVPEVRVERVMELKQKIDNPDYVNGAIEATADAVMHVLTFSSETNI
jgi:negative regulator of flagellin synthesis FlgM